MKIEEITLLANRVRLDVLNMVAKSKSSHVGACLSIADILAVLYGDVLNYKINNPSWDDRDRFILSKGHATAALYAVLAERGFFPIEWLESYNYHGAKLLGHCTSKGVPGIELSTGSLGHGLPVGLGMAKALKIDKSNSRVFVLVGDGECNEGAMWEAALLAPQLQLDNLCVIVDHNKIQSFGRVDEVINLEPFVDKWQSFGWNTQRINGHDIDALSNSFLKMERNKKPTVIIADTVKGKGVSYMEDQLEWHYKSPNNSELEIALKELAMEMEVEA